MDIYSYENTGEFTSINLGDLYDPNISPEKNRKEL